MRLFVLYAGIHGLDQGFIGRNDPSREHLLMLFGPALAHQLEVVAADLDKDFAGPPDLIEQPAVFVVHDHLRVIAAEQFIHAGPVRSDVVLEGLACFGGLRVGVAEAGKKVVTREASALVESEHAREDVVGDQREGAANAPQPRNAQKSERGGNHHHGNKACTDAPGDGPRIHEFVALGS